MAAFFSFALGIVRKISARREKTQTSLQFSEPQPNFCASEAALKIARTKRYITFWDSPQLCINKLHKAFKIRLRLFLEDFVELKE